MVSCDGQSPQLNGEQVDQRDSFVQYPEERTKIIAVLCEKTTVRACRPVYLEIHKGSQFLHTDWIQLTSGERLGVYALWPLWGRRVVVSDILSVNKSTNSCSFQRENATFSSVDIFKIEKCVYLIRIVLASIRLKAKQTKSYQIPLSASNCWQ